MSIKLSDEFARFHDLVINGKHYQHYNTQYSYLEAIQLFIDKLDRAFLDIQSKHNTGKTAMAAWLAAILLQSNPTIKITIITKQKFLQEALTQILDLIQFTKFEKDRLYILNLSTVATKLTEIKFTKTDFIITDGLTGYENYFISDKYLSVGGCYGVFFSLIPTESQRIQNTLLIEESIRQQYHPVRRQIPNPDTPMGEISLDPEVVPEAPRPGGAKKVILGPKKRKV